MNAKKLGEWVARTIKPGHVVPLIGLGLLLSCCGSSAIFFRGSSAIPNDEELTDAEFRELMRVGEITKGGSVISKAPPEVERKPSIDDFTPDQRILAERMRIADWHTVSDDTRLAAVRYIALVRHPNDSPLANSERVIWYLLSVDHATKIPAARPFLVEAACIASDPDFAKREEIRDPD
jgi:hypothetical protein